LDIKTRRQQKEDQALELELKEKEAQAGNQ